MRQGGIFPVGLERSKNRCRARSKLRAKKVAPFKDLGGRRSDSFWRTSRGSS
jgi:hypothetical protein